MIKPSNDVLRAMRNLDTNTSWAEIVNWFRDSLMTESIKNNHTTGEDTLKMQGRGLQLEEILNYINKADRLLRGGEDGR